MNSSDMTPLTTASPYMTAAVTQNPVASLSTQAATTVFQVATTAVPESSDSTVIAVVVVLMLLTIAALAFLLYRYLCHNKGAYRTTGELAPGEDPDEERSNQAASEKKEYFI
ncbi:uncharacterized protein LOC133005589 isoform X2 [Limanda limanda]|uniref:uncharacterized protein LOC133005589 isoform X2 n=1 Tax=Limanda limanda TaxID=27771 RepID=UPI0029C88180|nr:uncharacterized protein LOC133005589 isoform X2 [Limanda limanda]